MGKDQSECSGPMPKMTKLNVQTMHINEIWSQFIGKGKIGIRCNDKTIFLTL